MLISVICDFVFVCVSALQKKNDVSYQHQTWYTYHIGPTVYSSACIDPDVKRSEVKVTAL